MEHIVIKNSLDSKLQVFFICSIRILSILEVMSKIAKCLTLEGITINGRKNTREN